PGVFVVGDAASLMQNGHPVPGVAQAAIQEGRYVGRLIANELKGQKVKRPFRYFDKGNMAVVGKNYAVLERGWLRTGGFLPGLGGWAEGVPWRGWGGCSFTSSPCRSCRTACVCSASGSGRISPGSAPRG